MTQLDLFGDRPAEGRRRREPRHDDYPDAYPSGLPHVAVDTSREAAESIAPDKARAMRRMVHEFVLAAGETGATCDEVEIGTGLRHQTASARLRELEGSGHVVKTGERRATRSGRSARVYRGGAVG